LTNWGGVRENAGRKKTGRKKVVMYVTHTEEIQLKNYLEILREDEEKMKIAELKKLEKLKEKFKEAGLEVGIINIDNLDSPGQHDEYYVYRKGANVNFKGIDHYTVDGLEELYKLYYEKYIEEY